MLVMSIKSTSSRVMTLIIDAKLKKLWFPIGVILDVDEMDLILISLLLALMAFAYEFVDAALGQGYGTLGSPTMILLGFSSKLVVPAMLLSQVVGDFSSAFFHHKFKNVDFSGLWTPDSKRAYVITLSGVIGVVIASYLGASLIPKDVMTTYIGIIVTVMGILLLSGVVFKFTWKKLMGLGVVAAFNKGMSGGGYGPVVAGGQTVIGVGAKNSIGITDLAEGPICIVGFITWTLLKGISLAELQLLIPLCIGALIAPAVGAYMTYRLPTAKLKKVMGAVILILGVLTLLKVLNP
jgi:uncharacterized membrane protein YfcA